MLPRISSAVVHAAVVSIRQIVIDLRHLVHQVMWMAGTNKYTSLVMTSTLGVMQKGWSWRVHYAKVLHSIIDGTHAGIDGEPPVVIMAVSPHFWLSVACVVIVLKPFGQLKLGCQESNRLHFPALRWYCIVISPTEGCKDPCLLWIGIDFLQGWISNPNSYKYSKSYFYVNKVYQCSSGQWCLTCLHSLIHKGACVPIIISQLLLKIRSTLILTRRESRT